MPRYWLMKTEPETFGFADLVRAGAAEWDGVRNYQARNNLREMSPGDAVLIYHSGAAREVVGIARVRTGAGPDSTTDDPRWESVEVEAVRALVRPVSLAEIKADPSLADLLLVRHSRLSVMPVTAAGFARILALGQTPSG